MSEETLSLRVKAARITTEGRSPGLGPTPERVNHCRGLEPWPRITAEGESPGLGPTPERVNHRRGSEPWPRPHA